MCERYALTSSRETLAGLLEAAASDGFEARYNISPGQTVPAVAMQDDRRALAAYRWGFSRPQGDEGRNPLVFRARAETAANKAGLSGALQSRRCLAPADAWYAWKAAGRFRQPYMIRRVDRAPMVFAAVWEERRDAAGAPFRSLAILTIPGGADISEADDRMPAVVDPDAWDAWLDPRVDGASLAARRLKAPGRDVYEAIAIGALINQPGVEGPEVQQASHPRPAANVRPRLA